jgi:Bax protein
LKSTSNPVQRKNPQRLVFILLGIAVALGAVLFARASLDSSRIRVTSPQELSTYFESIGYTLKRLRSGNAEVPRFVVSEIPEDWSAGLTVDRKKSLFFRALLPMVLMVNEEIMADRARLRDIRTSLDQSRSLSSRDEAWVADIAQRYALAPKDGMPGLDARFIDRLLHRVDTVPPSLALSQAAVESAYASSRFAVEGNALFGQWHLGKGLVPEKQRTELGDYRVASFKSPRDSIRAYMRNLNTNRAYRPFRAMRAAARQQNERLRGAPLAAGLLAYSEKGQAYVSLLRSLIARNGLSALDGARLMDHQSSRIVTGLL